MLIPFSLLYVFNELCGIATDDSARGDVLGDYGSCGNDGILADSHAGQDDGTHTNPGIVADVDGLAAQHHSVLEVVVVTHQIIVIGVAAIVPHNAMADSLMEEISLFVEENCEAEILEETREIR